MRKAYAILCCLVFMMFPLCARDAGIWFQTNNKLTFGINLAYTISEPTGNWQDTQDVAPDPGNYNYTSYLGKVGSYGLSQPVTISISVIKPMRKEISS